MKRHLTWLGLVGILVLPGIASADYLYSVLPAQRQPRVFVLVDNTSAFTADELRTVKAELTSLLPRLDGLAIWLGRYGKVGTAECTNDLGSSLVDTTRTQLHAEVVAMTSGGRNSLASTLTAAKGQLKDIAKVDASASCRPYFVLLLTGGRGEKCSNADQDQDIKAAVEELRTTAITGNLDVDVHTFVIRYGTEPLGELIGSLTGETGFWNDIAKLGGTAMTTQGFCQHADHVACTQGSAMYASTAAELRGHLDRVFAELLKGEYSAMAPVIGTAPFVDTEVGRVARNFMAYTSFRMPGSEGHLYGVRLFVEESPNSGSWRFTNFNDLNLNTCGSQGNPCAFDAGRMLLSKVGRRKIFTATARTPTIEQESGRRAAVTLPLAPEPVVLSTDDQGAWNLQDAWDAYEDVLRDNLGQLTDRLPTSTVELDESTDAAQAKRMQIVDWLQGETRAWPLGDLYHSSATVIGPAGFSYRTRGYPAFSELVKNRPAMIYVGANDGMIHAFHANPKLTYQVEGGVTATWEAGEEAWAYLPVSMLARATSAILAGDNRFFSQDLSCRVDDVLVNDLTSTCGQTGVDPLCGWRTILLCGQGWGGSWYVALDVSDPLNPVPLWEATYAGDRGMGRSWTVPGIALLNDGGTPLWAALLGNGYNADMACKDTTACAAADTSRLLNLPFAGTFPYHGNGASGEANGRVFLMNMANGRFLDHWDVDKGPVVADTPVVDANFDGWTDAGFAGSWKSYIYQVLFSGSATEPVEYRMCPAASHFGNDNKAITSRPSALASTSRPNIVHVFVGTGVDGGTYPDEQTASGNQYDFRIYDLPANACHTTNNTSDLCSDAQNGGVTLNSVFSDGHRLVGAPIFVLRKNNDPRTLLPSRWLTFTSWLPPSNHQPCKQSEAMLRCLETSAETRCLPCGNLGGEGSHELDTGGRQPTSPTTADGQLYVTTPYGPARVNNPDGTTGGISGGLPDPNQGAPTNSLILGWREVFD